jgi:transcriptional regulator with XRE-family HTH domain
MHYRSGRCRIPELLRERGITMRQLSAETDIHETQLSAYANNRKTMSLHTAKAVASYFEIPIDDLYVWILTPPRSQNRRKND